MTGGRWAWLAVLAVGVVGCEEGAPPEASVVDAAQGAGGAGGAGGGGAEDAARPDAARPDAAAEDAATPDAERPPLDQGADASTCEPVSETCNGLDDDCDGEADEDIAPTPCYDGPPGTEDIGRCRAGRIECIGGELSSCRGQMQPAGLDECGDGIDNDCNGETDETCACREGESQPCGDDVGACEAGVQTCRGGAFGACEGGTGPGDEACNGADDDCDGRSDEALMPAPCYEGPAGTEGVGVCRGGTSACVAGGPGACEGQRLPGAEACGDGADNDCDGEVDEGCGCDDGDVQPCGVDVGACELGEQTCQGGVFGACVGAVDPQDEACNGVDDDCDGEIDGQVEGCYEGAAGTAGVGQCRAGTRTCEAGVFGACVGQVVPAAGDACDGVDNDCDGRVDEDFVAEATACGQGVCANAGQRICRDGAVVDTCQPRAGAADDRCDALDNDCDGRVDEGHVAAVTRCGVGGCAAEGRMACEGGAVRDTCVEGDPADEVQDAIDGDCDGRVDEGFPYTTAELQGRFNQICGGCHGNSGGLTLRGDFEADTVNVAALGAGLDLIEPGDPENSYLLHKLRGTQRNVGGGGSRMPLGGPFWADWELERLRLWILDR